jgi:hypothetical protein
MTMTTAKPPRTHAPVVDAVALLEEEHAATRELLAMLLRMTSTGRHRDRVVAVLAEDLWIHMQIEEELFYPALAGNAPGLGEPPTVRRALREALSELERCPVDAPELLAIARRVLDLHEEDSGDEAQHVFPHARRVLGADALVTLGQRLRARRQELRESGAVRREPMRPEVGLHRLDV